MRCDFYDYLTSVSVNSDLCLELNGSNISNRDIETLMHMAKCSDVPEKVINAFNDLYFESSDGNDYIDYSNRVLDIMTKLWDTDCIYGRDYAYTEMTNYINFLLST